MRAGGGRLGFQLVGLVFGLVNAVSLALLGCEAARDCVAVRVDLALALIAWAMALLISETPVLLNEALDTGETPSIVAGMIAFGPFGFIGCRLLRLLLALAITEGVLGVGLLGVFILHAGGLELVL